MRRSAFVAASLLACAGVAHAQSGWEARATMAPNPLPAGRCGDIRLELVDDHGYRRTTLSNGAAIDARHFKFTISDPSHITVQNDASVAGRVCADTGAAASTTTVTVTLPDGLVGTLQIVLVPKGQVGPRPIVYRSQAPLRLPTSPEYAPGFVVARAMARAKGASGGGAAGAGAAGAVGAADPSTDPAAVGAVGAADPATDPGAVGATGAADPATDPGAVGATGAAGTAGAGAAGTAGAGAAGAAGAASGSSLPGGTTGATPTPSAAAATPVVTKSIPAPTGASSADPKTSSSLRRGTSTEVSTGTLSLLGARHVPAPATISTGTLSLLGVRHVPAPATITTGTLSLLGARHVPAPAIVTTATLSLTGTNAPAAAPVKSPVGATPKPITSQKPPTP